MNITNMYQYLKDYIDKRVYLAKTNLKDLFTEYKTKEVGTNIDNVKAVGDNIDNVNTVNNNINNVNTTADNIVNINTSATNIDNINTNAQYINDINTNAQYIENINNVSTNINNINNVNANIDSINMTANNINDVVTISDNIDNVNITASSIDNVNTYALTYQGAYDSDINKRNNDDSLKNGDLYFNTTTDKMRVYQTSDSTWKDVGSVVKGIMRSGTFDGDGSTKEFEVEGGYDQDVGIVTLNGTDVTKDVDISDGKNIKFDEPPNDGDKIYYYMFGAFQCESPYKDYRDYPMVYEYDADTTLNSGYIRKHYNEVTIKEDKTLTISENSVLIIEGV